ncbi:MAG: hypothetical protein BWZ10_01786 [candidate division BRC1 bacterium ADurb.BinA364]|nr:MAG: hypothetical protein BWZ10_01786 [candidate division BRC1 bacterium ADurb.BinA364]
MQNADHQFDRRTALLALLRIRPIRLALHQPILRRSLEPDGLPAGSVGGFPHHAIVHEGGKPPSRVVNADCAFRSDFDALAWGAVTRGAAQGPLARESAAAKTNRQIVARLGEQGVARAEHAAPFDFHGQFVRRFGAHSAQRKKQRRRKRRQDHQDAFHGIDPVARLSRRQNVRKSRESRFSARSKRAIEERKRAIAPDAKGTMVRSRQVCSNTRKRAAPAHAANAGFRQFRRLPAPARRIVHPSPLSGKPTVSSLPSKRRTSTDRPSGAIAASRTPEQR